MSENIRILNFTKPAHNSHLSFIPPCIMNKSNLNNKASKQRNRKILTPIFGNLTERCIILLKYIPN
jgi:hypothetical protein